VPGLSDARSFDTSGDSGSERDDLEVIRAARAERAATAHNLPDNLTRSTVTRSIAIPVARSAAIPIASSAAIPVARSATIPVARPAPIPIARSATIPVARPATTPTVAHHVDHIACPPIPTSYNISTPRTGHSINDPSSCMTMPAAPTAHPVDPVANAIPIDYEVDRFSGHSHDSHFASQLQQIQPNDVAADNEGRSSMLSNPSPDEDEHPPTMKRTSKPSVAQGRGRGKGKGKGKARK
jgi:hypothetical protein